MAKQKTVFFCKNCGADYPKWFGRCPSCGEWNTCTEEVVSAVKRTSGVPSSKQTPERIQDVVAAEEHRIDTRNQELNRVLGGGLVPGSLVLVGGDPGIGKSTLILQMALRMEGLRVLYVSGEESVQQIKLRANRLQRTNDECYTVSETSLERIFAHMEEVQPQVVVIDSIQTIASEQVENTAGSITQIRECATSLLKYAKETQTPMFLIGHINKDGNIAGPKVLEHIVDTVLQFEGDQHYMYRILRSLKNRFGNTAELAIFEMRQDGLREVSNPSELLLTQNHEGLSGIAVSATIEGMRPFLIEVQSLVSSAVYGTPQRSSTGFDGRRLNMLLAVLEKRIGFRLAQKDVFLNIAGGIRVNDPAIDLAVIAAVCSSNLDAPIAPGVCMAGEVGLSGEIRPVTRIEQRIAEAEKLGFEKIIIPSFRAGSFDASKFKIEILPAKKVEDVIKVLFKG
ncbi:MAG: DNA repair protein RadA [Bacteroidales bacterium]|nr:DNA repair protein RadA [Bacteroidales bacterium]MBR6310900.1 DNA repair protein RadA [Paludibacteraceae bacterium]